ncbi:ATP-binding protein [bacterium]|nr:ATP-binding protein [bacterium]
MAKKIVIISGKGGVGKSMLSSTLAMLFAKTKKVVAVDCDVDAPNLAIWLNEIKNWDRVISVVTSAKPKIDYNRCDGCGLCVEKCRFGAIRMENGRPKLNPFLCEGCGACEVVCPKGAIKLKPVQNGEIQTKKTKYGFPLVSGNLFPGETGSGKVVTEIKKEADKFDCDIMLIDSAPGTGCPVIASLQDANFAVLITEPTLSGFSDLKRVLEVISHFRIPWGLVINKWDINKDLSRKIKIWAHSKFLGGISYDKKIFKAAADLSPILETKLRARKEIQKIFKKLNSIL